MASSVVDGYGDVEEEREAAGQLVDLKGNPLTSKTSHLGGWRVAILILGAAGAANVAFAGIFLNLVLYLTDEWGVVNAVAASNVTNVMGTMFTFAVVGTFLSDVYIGRYWGCTTFLALYFLLRTPAFLEGLGSGLWAATGTGAWRWVFSNVSLYVAAIGYGAFEPPFSALGGDQLDTPEEKGTFFNLFFVFCNVGQGVALVVLSSLEYAGMWSLGFGIGAATAGASLLFFLAGTPVFRHYRAGGNPLARIAQVLIIPFCLTIAHLLKAFSQSILIDSGLSEPLVMRWLDKAAMQDGGPRSKWRLCTVAQVEEVKCLVSIFPIWVTGVIYNITVAQLSTVFSEQGAVMGQPSWLSFSPSSMQVFNIGTNVVFGMVYDIVVTRLGLTKSVTKLQRMGAGLVVAVMSMVVDASAEMARLLWNGQDVQTSIFWLVPQYVLVGISQVLMVVAQMDFFYSEVSSGMRSLGLCLPLLARAFGNYASTFMVDIVTSITTRSGGVGWISQDLNQGHLDYFYWTVAGVVAVDFLAFLIFARSYTYLNLIKEKKHCSDSA
ncbi:hypothetical protein GOP47_0028531 [Adiantum capillus-veneris]|nr:hypothetical protein GOP47_0028531 [Adiantum capillus-veneris]